MRMAVAAVVSLVLVRPGFACMRITVALDVRHANVVAVARYAGERTFTVETILRTAGDSPSKLVAPENWRASLCAPSEPLPGKSYLVALQPTGTLQYREYESAAAERALIARLHAVTTRSILNVLQRYSSGDMSLDAADDWLSTAIVEPRSDDSLAEDLLERAETLLGRIGVSERCHKDAVRSLRTVKLPAALLVIEQKLPAVATEEAFVRQHVGAISDPALRAAIEKSALDEWDEIVRVTRNALGSLDTELRELPDCSQQKQGG